MLNFFMVIPSRTPPGFQILGCPVGNGGAECSRGCGGWYRIPTAALTQAYLANSLNPHRLCGPLADRVRQASEREASYIIEVLQQSQSSDGQ